MNYQEIVFALRGLSTKELQQLNAEVVETIKSRNRLESQLNRRKLRHGQSVKIDHDGYREKVYVILEIKMTKAVVQDPDSKRRMNVPMNLLSAA